MKFISTQGRIHKIDLRPSKWPRRPEADCKSKIQWRTGLIIDELFPNEIVLEEFFLPGDRLYLDFFLPRKKIAVEVMGDQHYNFNSFFHGSKEDFLRSQERDSRKSLWCTLNNISLVVIRQSDKEDKVRNKLLSDNH